MITMTLIEGRSKTPSATPHIARAEGLEAKSANGATMALARKLVEAGYPDQPWEARGVDGMVRLYGKSLHGLAGISCEETRTPRFRKFVEPSFPAAGSGNFGSEEKSQAVEGVTP